MTELEYICPLAHCVNLTWYAGGLLYFAGKESDRVTLYYTHLGGKPDKTPSVFGFSDKVTSTFGDTVEEDLARKTQDLSVFFEVERGNDNGSK